MKLDDKEQVFAYRSDKVTNKYQGWIPDTIEDVENFINRTGKEFNEPESWYQIVIIEKESTQIIGDMGIHFTGKYNKTVELGFTIAKEKQGQGFAKDAVKGVITHLFDKYDKHRIVANIDPRNTASIGLVESLGFRKEGHIKEGYFNGKEWEDNLIYAILEMEWT